MKLSINALSACELLIQEMGTQPGPITSLVESMQEINRLRLTKLWPFVTSMSCFNPSIPAIEPVPLSIDVKPLRAFWEAGLILVMKKDLHGGISRMLSCCKPLSEQSGNQVIVQISRVMMKLLPSMDQVDILIELAGRFDKCLRDADHLNIIPPECLLRDCLFYLSIHEPDQTAWDWTEKAQFDLQHRLKWYSKQFANLLYPENDDAKIDKSTIEKNLVPITDALLFLGEVQLRTRMILRLDKIDNRMLKIAVPVQLLMAEALRLA